MEATNISINKQSSVSINVGILQAIKQRVLSVTDNSSLFTLHSSLKLSLPRLYRHELRMVRAVAAWCDRHNTLMSWLMAIQVMAFAFYVFMFV
jgi:hypothetical protein